MARAKKAAKPLPPIWHADDELWARVEHVLADLDPPANYGPARIDQRAAFDGVIFRMRSGCQWNRLPGQYGDDASVHRTFQRWVRRWVRRGVLKALWADLVAACADLGGVEWRWQSADCVLGKARHGGDKVGPNPTDRGKPGAKRSVLAEADGGPLAVVVAPANVNDQKLLAETIEAVVVDRPDPAGVEQHLCLDKAYDNPTGEGAARAHGYTPHIRRIGEEKLDPATGSKRHPARRWVVERTIAWLNKCRGILIRYDKKAENYLALIQLQCALLWYRRHRRLTT